MTEKRVGWGSVLNEARRLADERGDAIEPAAFDNLADLIAFASANYAEPTVALGYWPTVLLSWQGLSLEVFEDRIEVYPASEPGVGSVWYEPHRGGEPFSAAFTEALLVAALT